MIRAANGTSIDLKQYVTQTQKLRELIGKVGNSGRSAWKAGEILKRVRDEKLLEREYKSFEDYTRKEFAIKESTATAYIRIHENFVYDHISPIMLVTHLKTIADVPDAAIKESILLTLRQEEARAGARTGDKLPYNNEVVQTIVDVAAKGTSVTNIREIAEAVIADQNEDKKQSPKRDRFGPPLQSPGMPDAKLRYENEPIDEMGVVALFCSIFDGLKKIPFEFEVDKSGRLEQILFRNLKFVRTAFPDACVRCTSNHRKTEFELHVEFEFESKNYWKHGHRHSPRHCDLVVCWEDNWQTSRLRKLLPPRSIPPTIALKNVMQTGAIELVKH